MSQWNCNVGLSVGWLVGPALWSRHKYLSNYTGWIDLTSVTDMYSPHRMNPTDCGGPLTFLLAPPTGCHFWLFVKYLNSYFMDKRH